MGEIIQYKNNSIKGKPAYHPDQSMSAVSNQKTEPKNNAGPWSEKDIVLHRELLIKLIQER